MNGCHSFTSQTVTKSSHIRPQVVKQQVQAVSGDSAPLKRRKELLQQQGLDLLVRID